MFLLVIIHFKFFPWFTPGLDGPAAFILRRADVRSRQLHGAERRWSDEGPRREGQNHSGHDPPTVFRTLRHV